jgi:hypothetical protein
VSETEALFGVLRQSADPGCAAAIEGAVSSAQDHELCRVNALAFATKNKLDEARALVPPNQPCTGVSRLKRFFCSSLSVL